MIEQSCIPSLPSPTLREISRADFLFLSATSDRMATWAFLRALKLWGHLPYLISGANCSGHPHILRVTHAPMIDRTMSAPMTDRALSLVALCF
ncbi:hypothetical protein VNO80_10193 [Phaseolus coccineus]|uniref:Uncharacterized protein n=1 Tax=Phaseolus coccineus TaxID=3886 RepID=A0AAN9N7Z0_PHACN